MTAQNRLLHVPTLFLLSSSTTGLPGHMCNMSSRIAQVLEMESLFMSPAYGREDLAHLLRSVQIKEKQKLNLVSLYFFALVLTTVFKIPGHNSSQADLQRHDCMNSICL